MVDFLIGHYTYRIFPPAIPPPPLARVNFGFPCWTTNLQANVSATIRLFGGDSSHTPFFDWQRFQDNTLYPLAIIHMEHINVLDFDDKFERNLCFPLETQGLYSTARVHNFFRPGRDGNSVGSEVTHRPMAAEINRCRLLDDGIRNTKRGWSPGDSLNLVRVLSVRVNYSQQCRNDINGRWEYSVSIMSY